MFFFDSSGDHRELHVLTHSYPTRRSSALRRNIPACNERCRRSAFKRSVMSMIDASTKRLSSMTSGFRPISIGISLPSLRIPNRSEEHTSELQSLMRIPYAVFCLKKKINKLYLTSIINQQHMPHVLY